MNRAGDPEAAVLRTAAIRDAVRMRSTSSATQSTPPRGQGSPGDRSAKLVDIVLAMAVLVAVGAAISADVGGPGAVPVPAYLFGVLFSALILARRRRPVAVLVVSAIALVGYYMLGYPPIGLALPLAAALFSAAECGRLYWAAVTATALLFLSTAVRLHHGDDPGFVLGIELPASAALMAAVIALGDSIRSRRGWRAELVKQAAAAAAEREQEARRRIAQERVRIARDLHDLLAHTVSVIGLHTDVAREALRTDPATAENSLAAVRAACRTAGRELRATLDALREPGNDPGRPLSPASARLTELVAATGSTGLTVELQGAESADRLPAVAGDTIFRLVQESLSNVLRHAAARHATIELRQERESILVRVTDDGRGGTGRPGTGWGIIGMRERIALLGGTLRAEPIHGVGFVVEARLPVRDSA
ncbi:sensor histidine kinase [Nocardia flavorosea]|uniref:histidine kinase n=1 Tax=Nocardia flavorosea TaxID=53429 RepID=A0A846YQR9_9NOCA|nr:histidine kinase [Nocardia flavorosea]NKY59299.1 sensor histidine kinase [Nocardia flavorosea]